VLRTTSYFYDFLKTYDGFRIIKSDFLPKRVLASFDVVSWLCSFSAVVRCNDDYELRNWKAKGGEGHCPLLVIPQRLSRSIQKTIKYCRLACIRTGNRTRNPFKIEYYNLAGCNAVNLVDYFSNFGPTCCPHFQGRIFYIDEGAGASSKM
jgi:hypothetical protein